MSPNDLNFPATNTHQSTIPSCHPSTSCRPNFDPKPQEQEWHNRILGDINAIEQDACQPTDTLRTDVINFLSSLPPDTRDIEIERIHQNNEHRVNGLRAEQAQLEEELPMRLSEIKAIGKSKMKQALVEYQKAHDNLTQIQTKHCEDVSRIVVSNRKKKAILEVEIRNFLCANYNIKAIKAPINKLSRDVLQEIVEWLASPDASRSGDLFSFGQTCSLWRNILHKTPLCWSYLILTRGTSADCVKLILERSKNHPLDVVIDISKNQGELGACPDSGLQGLKLAVEGSASRWKTLEVRSYPDNQDQFYSSFTLFGGPNTKYPMLQSFSILNNAKDEPIPLNYLVETVGKTATNLRKLHLSCPHYLSMMQPALERLQSFTVARTYCTDNRCSSEPQVLDQLTQVTELNLNAHKVLSPSLSHSPMCATLQTLEVTAMDLNWMSGCKFERLRVLSIRSPQKLDVNAVQAPQQAGGIIATPVLQTLTFVGSNMEYLYLIDAPSVHSLEISGPTSKRSRTPIINQRPMSISARSMRLEIQGPNSNIKELLKNFNDLDELTLFNSDGLSKSLFQLFAKRDKTSVFKICPNLKKLTLQCRNDAAHKETMVLLQEIASARRWKVNCEEYKSSPGAILSYTLKYVGM